MTYGTRSNQMLPPPPASVRTGEVYADEGTLIMEPASAYGDAAPPSYSLPPPPPSSVRPPASSWADVRGNWVVPAPPSTRSVPKTSRNDRGVIAAMGIGGLAVLASFAAALLAFSDEASSARGHEHAVQASAAAAPPPVTASLPAAIVTAPAPTVLVVTAPPAAPSIEIDDAPATVSAPAPVHAVVRTPKPAPALETAPTKPFVAASPAPAPKKPAAKASGKSQQEILEDLLEQQLAR